jgi:predicted dehydrogenase
LGVKGHKIAIVGTGRIINAHLDAIRATPGLDIAGIYGRDHQRTMKLASEHGLRAFKDFKEILSDPEIKIVDIITSSDLHADYGIEAARHKKNLIIEKPIDASVEKASKLVRISKENGCLLGVIYQKRFDEKTRLLRDLIERKAFGRLTSCHITSRLKRGLKYYQEATDGCRGVLINNGIHFIDLIIHLVGKEPRALSGVLERTRDGLTVEDSARVTMEFDKAFVFTLDISTNEEKSQPEIIELCGEKGSIVFAGDKIKSVSPGIVLSTAPWKKSSLKLYLSRKGRTPFRFKAGSHADVFANYLGALNGEEAVSVDGEEALASLRAVDEIYRSAGVCP